MDRADSLPLVLIVIGAIACISIQAQKISILESKVKPTEDVYKLVNAALSFANFILMAGILLLISFHYNMGPKEILVYDNFFYLVLGIVLTYYGLAIMSKENVAGKTASFQLALVGLVTFLLSLKRISKKRLL